MQKPQAKIFMDESDAVLVLVDDMVDSPEWACADDAAGLVERLQLVARGVGVSEEEIDWARATVSMEASDDALDRLEAAAREAGLFTMRVSGWEAI